MPLKEWDDLLGADGDTLGAQGGYECFRRPAPAVVVVLSDARPASSEFRTALEALAADGLGAKRTLEKISLVAINSERPEYNMKIIEVGRSRGAAVGAVPSAARSGLRAVLPSSVRARRCRSIIRTASFPHLSRRCTA